MSIQITIKLQEVPDDAINDVVAGLQDFQTMNSQIAGDAEIFLKKWGERVAPTQHKSAQRLGATPTGHLADAYQAIEVQSTREGAFILVPRASRLRAAFGKYVLTPKNGSKFLTIPASAEAYGKRAREFDDLFVVARPGKKLFLARTEADGSLKSMYFLTKEAEIPEDSNLIPFDLLAEEAADSVEAYVDNLISGATNSP